MMLALGLVLAFTLPAGEDSVSIRVSVVGDPYKTPDGALWKSGSWEVTWSPGDANGKVRLLLEPQGDGGTKRELRGEVGAAELEKALADLKKKNLFGVKDGNPCACDAPRFKVTAREGKTLNTFTFDHNHKDHDKDKRLLIDLIVRLVERNATLKPSDK